LRWLILRMTGILYQNNHPGEPGQNTFELPRDATQ
jgi:hypothetical protein